MLKFCDTIWSVKAWMQSSGDGLQSLRRVDAEVGFLTDALPPPPPIFGLIEKLGGVGRAEMFEVYNMGIGFCVMVADADVEATLAILRRHNRQAAMIGQVIADPEKSVRLPQEKLVGIGKKFQPA